MRADVMARLAAADPVGEPPAVQSPERLRRLIEDDHPPAPSVPRRPRGAPMLRRRVLLGAVLAIAVSVAGLLLGGGSSEPGVNVAAAAYAATSPHGGIVEAAFVAHSYATPATCSGSRWCSGSASHPETLSQDEWLDAATGQQRELITLDAPGASPPVHRVSDWVIAPGRSEEWDSAGRSDALTVEHLPRGRVAQQIVKLQHALRADMEHLAFNGLEFEGIETIELFRSFYRRGEMRLVGSERRAGKRLWKLESAAVARTGESVRAGRLVRSRELTQLVVLVDPKTFLPVAETQLDVSDREHPHVLVESELVRYRRVPAGVASNGLFDLAAQHPQAHVLTRPLHLPRVIELKRSGRGCPCFAVRGLRAAPR
jgi:hypothetical protein